MTDKEHSCQIFHFDLFGTRKEKYDFLDSHSLDDVEWTELHPQAPQYFFVPKDFSAQEEYEKGFKVDELMKTFKIGVETGMDSFFIGLNHEEFANRVKCCFIEKENAISIYGIKNSSGYPFLDRFLSASFQNENIRKITYRPLDSEYCYYSPTLLRRASFETMRNLLFENIALISSPQGKAIGGDFWDGLFVADTIVDKNVFRRGGGIVFPLYLYPDSGQPAIDNTERVPNLDRGIWSKISECAGGATTPEQIFDYIYGVLHTPSYRAKYKEFLKVDFPRIPYPTGKDEFDHIANIGTQLRELHLMESVPSMPGIAQFTAAGDNLVEKPAYREGSVFFNDTQCFSNVPEVAWNFYIGGYQPAQKWLKDRKGRNLTFDDILHYRNIIVVLLETHRLMGLLG